MMESSSNEDGPSSHYSHLLIGTSLTLSTLSAALSQSSKNRVLHIDPAEYYGSYNASLTLTQLVTELQRRNKSGQEDTWGIPTASITFPYFGETEAAEASSSRIPACLQSLDRHYSISLSPALQPAASPSLDVLVRSQVARYATFRLLQRTAVWDSQQGILKTVPASKEDVFKTGELSLIEKRKLMKFLQFAATYDSSASSEDGTSFKTFLETKFSLPPHLVTAIMYGIALCSSEAETIGAAMERLKVHLTSVGRYGNSAYLVPQYGGAGEIAQGYCRAAAVHGATFVLGKEIETLTTEQVNGQAGENDASRYQLKLKDIDEVFTADYVVGEEELVQSVRGAHATASRPASSADAKLLHGILVLDRSVRIPAPAVTSTASSSSGEAKNAEEEEPLETGLIVFPPGSLALQAGAYNESAITALVLGEGTFCCPKGQYVVHLTTGIRGYSSGDDAASRTKDLLSAAKAKILDLAADSPVEWVARSKESSEAEFRPANSEPLIEAYWLEDLPKDSGSPPPSASTLTTIPRHFLCSPSSLPLPTLLNTSASQSAHLYYTTLHGLQPPYPTVEAYLRKKRGGARSEAEYRGRGGVGPSDVDAEVEAGGSEGAEDEESVFFFPPSLDDAEGGDEDD
jgi:RAB protein geranylgeranyltransferase component A